MSVRTGVELEEKSGTRSIPSQNSPLPVNDIIEELLERVRRMEAQVATTAQLLHEKSDEQAKILERVRRMEAQVATTAQLLHEKSDDNKKQVNPVEKKASGYDPLANWDGESDLTRG